MVLDDAIDEASQGAAAIFWDFEESLEYFLTSRGAALLALPSSYLSVMRVRINLKRNPGFHVPF